MRLVGAFYSSMALLKKIKGIVLQAVDLKKPEIEHGQLITNNR